MSYNIILVLLVSHISLCHPNIMMLSHFCYYYSILQTILSCHVYLIFIHVNWQILCTTVMGLWEIKNPESWIKHKQIKLYSLFLYVCKEGRSVMITLTSVIPPHYYFKSNDKLNWGCKIPDILCKYGFNHVWLSQNVVSEDIFMLEFRQRVIDTFLIETISFFWRIAKMSFL